MVIAFSGGGTLGHITPALSFIQEIKSRSKNVKIIFIATSKDEKYETNSLYSRSLYTGISDAFQPSGTEYSVERYDHEPHGRRRTGI